MRADMVVDAVDKARWQHGTRIDGLR